jgi:hypothetical protein
MDKYFFSKEKNAFFPLEGYNLIKRACEKIINN